MDGLERRLEGKAPVMRLDVTTLVGRQAAAALGVRGVPTVLVVDGQGQVVHSQAGFIKAVEVEAQVDQLISDNGR